MMPPSPASLLIEHPTGRRKVAGTDAQLSIADALADAGLPLDTRCGRRGLCDGCLIELLDGRLTHLPTGRSVSASPTLLRACEHAPAGREVHLRIPARSCLSHKAAIVDEFTLRAALRVDPLIDDARDGDVGAAIDVGTTTVAVLLADLRGGAVLARASAFNRQAQFGDNVVTRITACAGRPDAVAKQRLAVARDTIAPLIADALAAAGVEARRLRVAAVAGNTTMLHLLAGVDPTPLGTAPFTPGFLDHRVLPAGGRGAHAGIPCDCHLLPGAAAYLGADIVAGLLAIDLTRDARPALFVDVGTNGEMVLWDGARLVGCATAAGPAFEGSGLSSGSRAVDGAVARVSIDETAARIDLTTIGGTEPLGICGTGWIDLIAELRRCGALGSSGRFDPAAAPPVLRDRVGRADGAGLVCRLTDGRPALQVSEHDIAVLLQAKGAIAAGVRMLLARCGLGAQDVGSVYLAGGFGRHMSAANAVAIGLLPGFRPDQVVAVGNTSLAGAMLGLLDRAALPRLAALARSIRVIELNLDPAYEDAFIDCLALP